MDPRSPSIVLRSHRDRNTFFIPQFPISDHQYAASSRVGGFTLLPWNDMKALLLVSFLIASAATPASAAIYLNDVVIDEAANIPYLAHEPWISLGRVFFLTQSPNGFVVVEVNRIGTTANFEFIHQSIAGGYGLCRASYGDEMTFLNFTPENTLGGSSGGNTLTLNSGQQAYIGYWASPELGSGLDYIFGWARVANAAGNLIVLSSASTHNGIIVGTTQAIPEPGPALLAATASLLLIRCRNRERRIMDGPVLPFKSRSINPRSSISSPSQRRVLMTAAPPKPPAH